MKKIIYLLLLLSFIGCTKDDSPESLISGIWLFKEGKYGTGGGIKTVKADPSYPIKLRFKKDGTFSIDAPSMASSLMEILSPFNRYQLMGNDSIRFYSTVAPEELIYYYELNRELGLHAPYCREGCSDYFERSY